MVKKINILEKNREGYAIIETCDDDVERIVAQIYQHSTHDTQVKPRALVMAVAPEMLEVLKAVDKMWSADNKAFDIEMEHMFPVGVVWKQIREIIKEATTS